MRARLLCGDLFPTLCAIASSTIMSASPPRREAPFAAAVASLLLLSLAPTASATTEESFGARRTVYYQDAACRLESFREYAYHARSMEANHTTREGRWPLPTERRDVHNRETLLRLPHPVSALVGASQRKEMPETYFFLRNSGR